MRTEEQLQELFNQAVADMKAAGIDIPMERLRRVTYNRVMRPWGLCHYNHVAFGVWRCEISFSRALCQFGTDMAFRRTAAHELIHLCKPATGHGWQFKELARIMHEAFPERYDITRCSEPERVFENASEGIAQAFKYVIKCPKCGHVWGHNRMSNVVRNPSSYHCKACKCDLVRVK